MIYALQVHLILEEMQQIAEELLTVQEHGNEKAGQCIKAQIIIQKVNFPRRLFFDHS
jgi:hypothetical protein